MSESMSLKELLKSHTVEGSLYEKLDEDALRCYACGHECLIKEGRDGICRVRYNEGGVLKVPFGYVAALQCDPTEKKPFFHAFPGSLSLTFGMLGCDYHCSYCQNWVTSQAIRDPRAIAPQQAMRPLDFVIQGKRLGAKLVVSSYNEPLITSEWAVAVFREAKKEGFVTGYVSNGNATARVLDYLRPWCDLYKIDLKGFNDRNYRKLGGVLQHVLDTIRMVHDRGFWLEIVTLLVPRFNDSEEEVRDMARFVAGVSPDIPWHVTAFHKDYKMKDPDNTSAKQLVRAAEIGYEEGLHFVYAGNLPRYVGRFEDTFCPSCGATLIERFGFLVQQNRLRDGHCPDCGERIPGRWSSADCDRAVRLSEEPAR
jgi:pyruvate formate lyase activating enzyme